MMCRAYSLYVLLDIMMKLHVLPVPPSNNFFLGGGGREGEALLCSSFIAQMLGLLLCVLNRVNLHLYDC